jgi:GTP cyclohydrolase I
MPTKKTPTKTVAKAPAKKTSSVKPAKKVTQKSTPKKSDAGTPLSVVIRRVLRAKGALSCE